ncbi:M23 family metallopeptidase [Roseivirga misakiensis]|uniref:M23ase beta-sheet core domain-containing protein n=1 Tax=Roseivirga misakiensis TaxID=1563681 RepID=A0A1E5T2Y5_9BACT|nr:M23 family metallopeptidase [Roseivirga misakiensis]OEK05732.1 hypothetical protein BFP71_06305 [Roseivirga misakiensis]
MKVILKLVFQVVFCFSFLIPCKAQHLNFNVYYVIDDNDDYVFYCNNTTGENQHLVVSFNKILGLRANTSLPYAANVGDGKRMLFKLQREGLESFKDFSFNYSIYAAKANPKIRNIKYALPIKAGKSVEVKELTELKELFDEKTVSDKLYGLAFMSSFNDTIYASRSGVVKEIEQYDSATGNSLIYNKRGNYIEIEHRDGTIATYSLFKNKSSFVKEGDDIVVGSPLAIVAGSNYDLGPHFVMTISYLKYKYDKNLDSDDWYTIGYVVPKFQTFRYNLTELQGNSIYTAVFDDELITQEMTRKQKKKYLKSKR